MHLEVDQSGRIEETQRDTIIAIANKTKHFTTKIPARTKRSIQLSYKKQGRPKMFAIITFAQIIALTIRKSRLKPSMLSIDIEYPGHEQIINQIIKQNIKNNVVIRFKQIGKSSQAHYWAYFTYKKKFKPNLVAKLKDIKRSP